MIHLVQPYAIYSVDDDDEIRMTRFVGAMQDSFTKRQCLYSYSRVLEIWQ